MFVYSFDFYYYKVKLITYRENILYNKLVRRNTNLNLIELIVENETKLTTLGKLDTEKKKTFAQYFTPIEIAKYMASLFSVIKSRDINILDAGAGTGILTLAVINTILSWERKPKNIFVEVYEIDESLMNQLARNLDECKALCMDQKINLQYKIHNSDFINIDTKIIPKENKFDLVILNPPYKKIESGSLHDKKLKSQGMQAPNYYAAFIILCAELLKSGGQLVTINPRSFCNGAYFKNFRIKLLNEYCLEDIHLFENREDLFHDDVLQETLIMKVSNKKQTSKIQLKSSIATDFDDTVIVEKKYDEVIFPTDADRIIRIVQEINEDLSSKMEKLVASLSDINLELSTGPIVDFRNRDALKESSGLGAFPMLYAHNIRECIIDLSVENKKPGYIIETDKCKNYLRPNGLYVLVNRTSSKEEPKRIKAAIYDGDITLYEKVGFDNKLNYYHINKGPIQDKDIAIGLWIYLNSDFVDFYFRTFSGSTQVNATDLKCYLKYPSNEQLKLLGQSYKEHKFKNYSFDELLNELIF